MTGRKLQQRDVLVGAAIFVALLIVVVILVARAGSKMRSYECFSAAHPGGLSVMASSVGEAELDAGGSCSLMVPQP